jgi:hypothetical protein
MFTEGADSHPSQAVLNDPHVESLTYRLVKPDYVTYSHPPPSRASSLRSAMTLRTACWSRR